MLTLRPQLLTGEPIELHCYIAKEDVYNNGKDKYWGLKVNNHITVRLKVNGFDTEGKSAEIIENNNKADKIRMIPTEHDEFSTYCPSFYSILPGEYDEELYYWIPLLLDELNGRALILAFLLDDDNELILNLENCLMSEWFNCLGLDTRALGETNDGLKNRRQERAAYYTQRLRECLNVSDETIKKIAVYREPDEASIEKHARWHLGDKLYEMYENSKSLVDAATLFNDEKSKKDYEVCCRLLSDLAPKYIYDGFGNHLGYSYEGDFHRGNDVRGFNVLGPHRVIRLSKELLGARMDYSLELAVPSTETTWLMLGLDRLLEEELEKAEQIWADCNKIGPINQFEFANFLIRSETLLKHIDIFMGAIKYRGLIKDLYNDHQLGNLKLRSKTITYYTKNGHPRKQETFIKRNVITLAYNDFLEHMQEIIETVFTHYDGLDDSKTFTLELLYIDDILDVTIPLSQCYTSIRVCITFAATKSGKTKMKYRVYGGAVRVLGGKWDHVDTDRDTAEASEPLGRYKVLKDLVMAKMNEARDLAETLE